MTKSRKLKKLAKAIADVLVYVFIIIAMLSVTLTLVSSRSSDGAVTVFGKQMRIVLSESMERNEQTDVSAFEIKNIPIRSVVFIDTVPKDMSEAEKWYDTLKVGDVLTIKYVYVRQETITHRITKIEEKPGGGSYVTLEGDNKAADADTLVQVIDTTETNSPNYIVGRVTGFSLPLGFAITALKSPAGIICIIIIPALIILVTEIFRIARLLSEDKKKSERAERDAQLSELEELRRRLAELEGKANAAPVTEIAASESTAENAPPDNAPNG